MIFYTSSLSASAFSAVVSKFSILFSSFSIQILCFYCSLLTRVAIGPCLPSISRSTTTCSFFLSHFSSSSGSPLVDRLKLYILPCFTSNLPKFVPSKFRSTLAVLLFFFLISSSFFCNLSSSFSSRSLVNLRALLIASIRSRSSFASFRAFYCSSRARVIFLSRHFWTFSSSMASFLAYLSASSLAL